MKTAVRALPERETFWRTLQTFNITRTVIALLLLVYLSINQKQEFWATETLVYRQICLAYLLIAVFFAALAVRWRQRLNTQLLTQVAIDIAIISMLYVVAGGARSGLAILYLFPLVGAAILTSLPLALFFAAVVTLILLADSGYRLLNSAAEASTLQAGLYGAAFFAAVLMINRLATRLIKQELLAAQRGQDLRVQQTINRMVIADMGDGILVIGSDGTIFTANPAAENMLGLDVGWKDNLTRLDDLYSLLPIAKAFAGWQIHRRSVTTAAPVPETPVFVVIKPDGNTSLQGTSTVWGYRRELNVHLQLRFARVDTVEPIAPWTVIFLQDVTEIENQAQQLKLASMGRLTASIAHEVRNPLSAISHAATLLTEDVVEPGQHRLLRIVGDNVERLNRMIEDILKLSRKVQQQPTPLLLEPLLREFLEEFRGAHGLADTMILAVINPDSKAWFDPLHLREVLHNLLGNACRYASGRVGSIRISTFKGRGDQLELHVQDDGPAMSPEVRAHLFEPFYTTSSKGTGLGLYLARELCLNNGALLDYEYRMDGGKFEIGRQPGRESGRFVITFAATGLR